MNWQEITTANPKIGETVETCIDAETSKQKDQRMLKRVEGGWMEMETHLPAKHVPTHYREVAKTVRRCAC